MELNLKFDIIQQDCCDDCCGKITIEDTTCEYNPVYPAQCCDGYGVPALENPTVYDIGSVKFNWITPSGTLYQVCPSWVPGRRGYAKFTIDSGTTGAIAVFVNASMIGYVTFITDLATTTTALIQMINALSADSGYRAYLDETTSEIVIETLEPTADENGKVLAVNTSGDIATTITEAAIIGGTADTRRLCLNSNDIYGSIQETPCNGNIEDGVHKITYIIYNDQGEEIARTTQTVLITCQLTACMERAKKYQVEGACGCSPKVIDKRLLEIRLQLEIAELMMCEGKCDCANDLIQSLLKKCKHICTDCD